MIIGITGKKRAGKSTLASFISKEINKSPNNLGKSVRGSFALPIKQFFHNLFGIEIDDSNKEKVHPELGKTIRELYQLFGTEICRNIHEDFWVIAQKKFIEAHLLDRVIIYDDIRFDNEAKFIRQLGGKIVQINRPDEQEEEDNHISELGISSTLVDWIIINDGSIQGLGFEVTNFLESLEWKI